MQPPPPNLTIVELRKLISSADIIVKGEVIEVTQQRKLQDNKKFDYLDVVIRVEELLKGEISGDTVLIEENISSEHPFNMVKGVKADKGKSIVVTQAGPRWYHGRYKKGERVILFLSKLSEGKRYKPLGSGTYNRYLCEFIIGDKGIQTLYFAFAEDVKKYAGSEERFIHLIKTIKEGGM